MADLGQAFATRAIQCKRGRLGRRRSLYAAAAGCTRTGAAVGEQQFLVLLFVVQAELDQLQCGARPVRAGSARGVDIVRYAFTASKLGRVNSRVGHAGACRPPRCSTN
jgi:hypothetical protein